MLRLITLIFVCFYIASARRSPHADLVEEYFMRGPEGAKYSDNILQDALLDVPGLVAKYRYPIEVHTVTTEDGYILEMHRIPHGRDKNNVPDTNKPVVLVMHGLFASAADWVLMGPGTALAYELAEEGFDVWLGNARGTFYSRNHVSLDPDVDKSDYWSFGWDEIGTLDLPAMIDYALKVSGKSRLHYIGHSQGTTVFWAMAAVRPEYNDKIISMQAFAPVAFMANNKNPVFIALGPLSNSLERIANRLGVYELLPKISIFTQMEQILCANGGMIQSFCSNFSSALFYMAGQNYDMNNMTMVPVQLGHTPAGSSLRQIVHYGQHIRKDFFRRFDHGSLNNWWIYRSFSPPSYDLSKITAPVFLHYTENDVFTYVADVQRLFAELGRPIEMLKVPHATFRHVDFMWGQGAKEVVYDRTIKLMKCMGDE